jgi:hypothetical protein
MRWLVLASLFYSVFVALRGWICNKPFSSNTNRLRHVTATIAHIQLLLGCFLYVISPLMTYFRSNFTEAVHQRELRFFGMEHSAMMLLSIALISVGSIKTKKELEHRKKHRSMFLWYGLSLLLILSSIPWGFGPFVARPFLRHF